MHVYAVNNNKRDWIVRVLAIMDVSVFFVLGYFSVNEKMLGLYKKVCRRYLYVYRDCIKFYIEAYREMWGRGG